MIDAALEVVDYNLNMDLKELMQTYQAGWKAVEEVQREERRSASLDLRWRQLNAAYGLAKGLGILKTDPTETEVFHRWAILKEKASRQSPKV
jgi:hypothetical protein